MSFLGLTAAAAALAASAAAAPSAGAAFSIDWSDPHQLHSHPELAFRQWTLDHAKDYISDAETFTHRFGIFRANAELVRAHNLAHPATTLELNEFADLTVEEFAQTRLGFAPDLVAESAPGLLGSFRYADSAVPNSIDWVERGAVTAVKNQGQCGSCWAFSTTGSIEGANFLATDKLATLSEQELVDCDHNGDNGCGGGLMNNAFEFVIKNGGIDTETDYAYWGAFPSFCNRRKQADRHVVSITGYEQVPANDEAALARAVANQPVSVAICVNNALMFYKSGVFDASCCTGLNHGVLLVGYGEEDGTPYWKVKNSWGSSWGEDGYFKLKKDLGAEGQCGVAMMASYPVKDDKKNPVVPTICDPQLFSLWECPAETSCSCSFDVFGLLCLSYECVPKDAVECGDGEHYCDGRTPNCDFAQQRCFANDEELSSPLLLKSAAQRTS